MWKKYVTPSTYMRFMKRVFLRLEMETLMKKRKLRRVMQNGIAFSHESGLYAERSLKVHMKTPEGYTIAFTTNGTIPSQKDDSGKYELEVTLNRNMSGYLVDHRDLILCPELGKSVLCQDNSLPAGIVLNTALVDKNGIVSDKVKTNVYFLEADFAFRAVWLFRLLQIPGTCLITKRVFMFPALYMMHGKKQKKGKLL